MKTHLYILMAALVFALAGCSDGTSGGPGAVPRTERTPTTNESAPTPSTMEETKQTVLGPKDDTFKLDVPALATDLKQGETKNVEIGIARGDEMDQDVTLSFSDVPAGVTIEPANPMIKHGETEVPLMITAKTDAALGDFTVKVNGKPATGATATTEFKISISEA